MAHEHGQQEHGQHDQLDPDALLRVEYWDERYSGADQVWSGNANQRLVEQAADLAPGRALDIGCGEGGDAIWLARAGWQVTAVDWAQPALDRAAAHAQQAGVDGIEWQRHDVGAWQPEPETYDLVSAQFFHQPSALMDAAVLRWAAAVRPGGSLLVVGHHPDDMALGRPDLPDFFYTADHLAQLLPSAQWMIAVAGAPQRTGRGPDGSTALVRDAVLRAVRAG